MGPNIFETTEDPVMTSSAYDEHNIFAKILRGELPSEKVFEDENTIVIMDIMPRADGHVLVLPKKRFPQHPRH